ncbi:Cyclic di-GMP phosphodiesterase YfgF [Methylophaga muralis]|uniref:Cyclic di-GMP phosphodiesterase YfgF n=1 Tax=Methylophaga muralis TaxID=291169 RepID=A0A1E3GMY9_9GAMM|nr:Cyclic di-GMP phosphodiesterase YfgF [Methylophaga muralis]
MTKYINEYGITADEIELEITESSEIPDTNLTDIILQQLVDTGVNLAMDDFGMGYSSLLYMRRFPVDAIKIDGSITRDVLLNDTNADIIRTICSLGQAQKVHVVAEYVETKEQLEALSEMGCDIFQGYFYSPPIAESDCLNYFKLHNGLVQGKLSI